MAILLNIEFALPERVPELDCAVAAAAHNLPVVRAEAHGEHVAGVADEAARREAGVEVPQAQRVVPRGRQRELAVGRDDDVGHEVVVPAQHLLRVAVRVVAARELPHDDGLVWQPASAVLEECSCVKQVPRDAVRIMSGFSEDVAMAVTQPLWPVSEPRNRSCSAIVLDVLESYCAVAVNYGLLLVPDV